MNDWLDDSRNRRNGITIRITPIRITLLLSLLLHFAVLWTWWPDLKLKLQEPDAGKGNSPINVVLAPRASPPPAPPPSPPVQAEAPSPPVKARPAKPAPRPAPRPSAPIVALNKPAPGAPPTPPPPPPAAKPAPQPQPPAPTPSSDLAGYIEARRRAREAQQASLPSAPSAPPVTAPGEDANARASRMLAGDIANDQQAMRARTDPSHSGGVFEVTRVGYRDAEFIFYGWNKEFRRNWATPIPVELGKNANMQIAIVRKMISIIREYEQGDFSWYSYRLGKSVTLSAAQRDNAGLEDFMMKEFFAATAPR
jgi:hypothetical protein